MENLKNSNTTTSFCFLTVGKTQESVDTAPRKLYIGLASSYVLAVNPDKKELEDIYGREMANEPVYVQENAEKPTVKIDFIVKTDPSQCGGVEMVNRASFFLSNEPVYNNDQTKMQVIDEYGNSAWGLVDDVKNGRKIQYNGKDASIAPKYRPAYRGEVDLIEFLKAYLCVASVFNYVNGEWVMKDGNTDDYKFSLEHIKDYFKGDVSEFKEALKLQPKNKVKLLYGVRTTDSGQFQNVMTRNGFVLRNNVYNTAKLAKNVATLVSGSTEYKVCPLEEYVPKTTDLSSSTTAGAAVFSDNEMPWD